MIAMLSYKSDALLTQRFDNRPDRNGGDPHTQKGDAFDIEGYLTYQGAIFEARMEAGSYLALTRAMDLFDVRTTAVAPGTRIDLIGIASDWLFPGIVRPRLGGTARSARRRNALSRTRLGARPRCVSGRAREF